MLKRFEKATRLLLRNRAWLIALFQACLIAFSLFVSWLLRFDFRLPERSLLVAALPSLICIRLLAIARFNLLRGWWRYVGVSDVLDIAKAVLLGSLGFFFFMRWVIGNAAFPISIYPLEAMLTGTLLAGVRLLSRVVAESVLEDHNSKRVIIVGAGFAAQMLIRETKRPDSGYHVVSCVDDNISKRGIKIQGVPVVATVDQLPELVKTCPVDLILIAVPSATAAEMRRFVDICERTNIPFRTVPAMRQLIAGQPTINQLREVNLEDLLEREPVRLNLEPVRQQIAGRVVMVTGAAGSIGSELCRQILTYDPATLICVDQSETGIFYLEHELSQFGSTVFAVGDIGDSDCMRKLFSLHGVQIVFHAAAYKHVPVVENNVQEAVKNNVFNLCKLLAIADGHGCSSFVLISSDKAVNPTSIMGSTKRIGEMIIYAWPSKTMRCVSVRFGNVLGSSGSVIPIFRNQIERGQPLTITHPDMKRFFMTVHEAVALVLQAFAVGEQGDILVLDMGEPVSVMDLAKNLIRFSGKTNVEIRFTGLRKGEKLAEELFYPYEQVLPTSCKKVKRARSPLMTWPELRRCLDELHVSMNVDGAAPVRTKIKDLVPEYDDLASGSSFEPVPVKSIGKAASAND